jgi:hypothetical protein
VFERDYLVRLLTQAGLILGRAQQLREQQKQKEALELVDEYLGKELRLRSRLAMGLSDEDLLSMLSVTGNPNAESVTVVAAFLQREAELLADLGQEEESIPRYAKALRLNLYLIRNDMEIEGWDVRRSINELLAALAPYELDGDTKRVLWPWFEGDGKLAEAENMLYELAEAGKITAEEGRGFYERLSAYGDAELEAGGLPRDEMEEGRRQWGALMKENAG